MARGNLFLSQGRGKVGSVVFSVIKGQQIERVYNPQPANPRSYAQQSQRSLLANMVKFYKRGTANFYKFAFEDRTNKESDYNAFARNNIKNGAYLTKEQFDAPGFPAIGRYVMTKGSIAAGLEYGWVGDYFGIKVPSGSVTSIGTFSSYLLTNYPGIAAGDLITFVRAWSALDLDFNMPTESPEWQIAQFYIDPTDTRVLSAVGLTISDIVGTGDSVMLGFNIDGTTSVSMGSICVSRQTTSGLKVSDSQLVLSPLGQCAMDWLASEYQRQQAAASWGGNPEAVLAGGLISKLPEITSISIATNVQAPWQRRDIIWASGQGTAMLVAGQNLKTTAQGGSFVFKFYGADTPMDNTFELVSPTKVTTLTTTGSSTQLQVTIPRDVFTFRQNEESYAAAQGFYVIEYNGVVIAYGTNVAG